MSGTIPSSPRFFRIVERSMLAGLLVLLVLAALVPAPLEAPADPAHPPNPAKSAWFLLWIQELVSYDTLLVYLVVALAAGLVALPWLPLPTPERAAWFGREHRAAAVVALLAGLAVLALTIVGLWFRGPNWRLVSPF